MAEAQAVLERRVSGKLLERAHDPKRTLRRPSVRSTGAMAGSFTGLESGILDLIVRSEAEIAPSLAPLIATSLVTERENTGHGFFTTIQADRTAPPVAWKYRLIDGPSVRVDVSGRVLLMGTILWLENSYPSCLEGFQYEVEGGGEIDLHNHDLSDLKLLGLMEI